MNKILKFLFIILFVAAICALVSAFTLVKFDKKSSHLISSNKSILIIGNSQSEYGLNDTIIKNAINISQSGDCSYYNYFKGKKLIDENQQIKTVIYLYTNNMFLKGMDEWIYDEKHMGYKLPKYAHTIDVSDHIFLLLKNPGVYLVALRDAVRSNLQTLAKRRSVNVYQDLDWGYFKTSFDTADLSRKDAEFDKFYSDTSTSSIDIHYVTRLYNYCTKNNVEFILVRLPFHNTFPKVKEYELFRFQKENLNGVEFWDFTDSTFTDYEFKDVQHLNFGGSSRLSKMINEMANQKRI